MIQEYKDPIVYRVEIESHELFVIAFSLLEAMECAIEMYNSAHDDDLGLEAVEKIKALTTDTLFFSEQAKAFFVEHVIDA